MNNPKSQIPNLKSAEGTQSEIQNPKSVDWLILSLAIFALRLLNLDVFLTPDEPLFLEHARDFAAGLTSGDLSLTLGIGYPGVTVAWGAAPVVGLAQTELAAYVAGRVVITLANGLLLLVIYALARSVVGRWPAFLGVALLALDPYFLAYSRLLHNDALLALLMTLAGLAFLRWLHRPPDVRFWGQKRWLFFSGLFTGLALLTKSTALLLGPLLVALLVGWAITQCAIHHSGLNGYYALRFTFYMVLQKSAGLMVVALLAGLVFFVLWPAMWSQPLATLNLTFDKLFTDQEAGAGNQGMFWLGQFVQDPGPFFYPVAFVLKATPWLLLGLALSLWQLISSSGLPRKNAPPTTYHTSLALPLWLFALTYLLFMTIASKKSVRYLLPAFPVFYLLAGMAFYQTGELVRRRTGGNAWRIAPSLRPLLVLPFAIFTFFYHPYYFTYYNPVLLGWLWAPQTLLVGWGEGLDHAAHYLSQRPAGTVAPWYEWIFSLMYQGKVQSPNVDNLITADHTVFYINQVQRDLPNPHIVNYFRTRRRPEYTVRLAGIDYAWVYPGPLAGFRPDPGPQYALGGEFGGEVRLLGYDLSQPQLSGQPLIVTLYWRVLAPPPTERFVYVRLVDAQGHIWAKTDSPPLMGLWPVSRWQSEMLLEDAQELRIPPGTPPGLYRLEVGWYDPASGRPLSAAGQPLGQGGGLLLGEIQLGWQPLAVPADLPHQTDARLAPNARLAGYDALPAAATTGDLLSIRLAWREAAPLLNFGAVPNNFVMFEWRQAGRRAAEQLEPLPFPIERWGRNALLLSQHEIIVPPTLAAGRYELRVMLHTGSDPAGEAFSLGTVEVTSPAHQFDLPATALAPAGQAQLDHEVALAGYELQASAQSLQLNLYWRTRTPLSTRYKVFAQLLSGDNVVIAQSDSFPAQGQRPTTGWLPGEIITDPHTLNFPAPPVPGVYRLIAGLYNPLTGQRLPLANGPGQASADAILIAELALP